MTEEMRIRLEKGKRVQFTYNDKPRVGTIDLLLDGRFVMKLDFTEQGTQYKSFSFGKIVNLQIIH